MNNNEFIKTLYDAFEKNGLSGILNDESAGQLYRFSRKLVETNKLFNLTAITDDEGIILKHFVDCATVVKLIPENAKIIDVGCGAGFPSLPIAILRKDVIVTSLDSTTKKISFINETAREIGINNIHAIVSRAEDHAKQAREQYDVAISRAVARLNILDEICIPLVKINGLFIAMKSSRGEEELAEAMSGIEKLGCAQHSIDKISLSYNGTEIDRENYVFKKIKQTPLQYPRNYSQISKKPL